jgi:plasmid stabilization system protein ParE
MRLAYHPLVQSEVNRILRHYDRISPRLGDEFWEELMRLVELVSLKPERFHFADRGLRRANMRRFPYHLLFREGLVGVRVIVVRHNRRHPSYGTGRR